MGWKEGGCEDWLFFIHTSVCSECSSDNDADVCLFVCFFVDLISEGTFCHIWSFKRLLRFYRAVSFRCPQ